VQADGAGWPDLTLVNPHHGILFRELKVDTGRLRDDQADWITALKMAGGDADTWRPMEFSRIADELQGKRTAAA
jgi:hypothetical protein